MAIPRIQIGLARDERLPIVLLVMFFATLCLAGGASREDVLAQAVIRAAAVVLMLVQTLFGRLPDPRRYKVSAVFLASMTLLAILQLIPLPPSIWTALPGRAIVANSPLGGEGWRPINLVPDAGWNALFSLLVPLCILFLLSTLRMNTVRYTHHLLMAATVFSALLALMQAAGVAPDNPLINGSTTEYAGIFANRNHQALFLAIGILLSWFWGANHEGSWRDRRFWLAVFVIILLFVSILVTGSRSGTLLGALAVIGGPIFARAHYNVRKRNLVILSSISIAVTGAAVALTAYVGRATSLDRAANLTLDSEFRLRSLSTVWTMVKSYFPFGAGLGSFDNTFRIVEPFSLLEPTYFNHAHNDFLEIVIETGVFGPAILVCAGIWIVRRIFESAAQPWKSAGMVRMGALVFGLICIASVSDYPARTPMIMATSMIAACWMHATTARKSRRTDAADALPLRTNAL